MARVNPAPAYTANDDLAIEDPDSGMSWASILGGAVAAIGITVILSPLGTALGFASVSPWNPNPSDVGKAITAAGAIWMVVVQWLSSGLGGYLTGRLRTKWVGAHTHEVFFRDTAHGFLAWAVATLFLVGMIAMSLTSISAGSAAGRSDANSHGNGSSAAEEYYTDMLFRSPNANTERVGEQDRAEATRIMAKSLAKGNVSDNDRIYLSRLISLRTGLSPADADQRITNTLNEQKAALDTMRKAITTTAIMICVTLLLGALIASIGGALGGRHRDIHYETGSLRVS